MRYKSNKSLMVSLVIGFLMLAPGLAHAQSRPPDGAEGKLRGFEGVVVDGFGGMDQNGTLTIRDVRTGEERMILMTTSGGQPSFVLKTAGGAQVSGEPSTIRPGAGVAVLARLEGGRWNAVEVLVKPDEPTSVPKTGVVLESNEAESTITLITPSGVTHTFQLQENAPVPADGDVIIAFVAPQNGIAGSNPVGRVTGLTRAADVSERLEAHIAEVSAHRGERIGLQQDSTEKHIVSLVELLEKQTSGQVDHLKKALDHSSKADRPHLVGALNKVADARFKGRLKANEAVASLKGNPGQPDEDYSSKATGKPDNPGASNKADNSGNPADGTNSRKVIVTSDDDNDSGDRGVSGNSDNRGNEGKNKDKTKTSAPGRADGNGKDKDKGKD